MGGLLADSGGGGGLSPRTPHMTFYICGILLLLLSELLRYYEEREADRQVVEWRLRAWCQLDKGCEGW